MDYHYTHFLGEATKAQRDPVACPRSSMDASQSQDVHPDHVLRAHSLSTIWDRLQKKPGETLSLHTSFFQRCYIPLGWPTIWVSLGPKEFLGGETFMLQLEGLGKLVALPMPDNLTIHRRVKDEKQKERQVNVIGKFWDYRIWAIGIQSECR